MEKINSFISLINKELDAFSASEEKRFPKELYAPISYTVSLGGKRIRPLLVLLSCDLFDGEVNDALPAAIAIELFHNFTLVHDDIMDQAPLRRGKETVYSKWNHNIAILSGDALMVKAYEYLTKTNASCLAETLTIFNTAAIQVCEGQQLDMNFEKQNGVSIAQYIHMIELKTAVLLAGSMKIGALIGNARKEDAHHIYEFAKNIGIAFQLHDDLLDVYGEEEKFGKQKGGDIVSNKKTFLLLKALEISKNNAYKQEELLQWIHAPQFNNTDKIEAVTAIYNFFEVKKLAELEMKTYYNKAIQHLQEIPADIEKKNDLELFINQLMNRET